MYRETGEEDGQGEKEGEEESEIERRTHTQLVNPTQGLTQTRFDSERISQRKRLERGLLIERERE